MKNTIYKFFIIILMIPLFSLSQYTIHDTEYPNGAYLQDTNNELDHYTGTWRAIHNNKQYDFQFVKFLHHLIGAENSNNFHYRDAIFVKLKVIDLTTNQLLYDDSSITNANDLKIKQTSTYQNKLATYWYIDSQNCNMQIHFLTFKSATNPNELKYKGFEYYTYDDDNCPYSSNLNIPMFLPKEDVIFTKQ